MIDVAERIARPEPRLLGIFVAWRLQAYSYILVTLYAVMLASNYRAGGWLIHAGVPLYTDFTQQWIAAGQALRGNIAVLYDPARFIKLQEALVGPREYLYLSWPYPPTFLLFIAPFALLSYTVAFLSWNIITLFACVTIVTLIVRRLSAVALVLASPFTAWNFCCGQNGCLTATLLGGALYFLQRRPMLAGIFIGCLTYKPQWGLLIPAALVAGKQWRALASAAATALMLAGVSLAAFGISAWAAFPRELMAAAGEHFVAAGHVRSVHWEYISHIPTVYGLVRGLHGGAIAGWLLQAAAAIAAAVVVWLVWRSQARYRLKAATVSASAFLAAPHAFAYDFAALAIPVAFLGADQMRCGFERGEQTILLVMFGIGLGGFITIGALPLGSLMIVALLTLILRRVLRSANQSLDRRLADRRDWRRE